MSARLARVTAVGSMVARQRAESIRILANGKVCIEQLDTFSAAENYLAHKGVDRPPKSCDCQCPASWVIV